MTGDKTLELVFAQANSIDDLLEQLEEYQSRGIKILNGAYFSSIEIEVLVNIINKLRFEYSKDEIYKSVRHMLTGH